ncbi:MAG: hypothetical protein JSS34_08635 [Proteobacteria bacterium]|nr:hypothetical protein [Pseudomonadota bacterium]
MFKKFCVILFLFFLHPFIASSFAAGQFMHVHLADLWLQIQKWEYTPDQRQAFILGTLFPDIRYLGDIKREETHEKSLSRKDIEVQKGNPFEAGRKLHVWINLIREQFVEKYGIYEKFPKALFSNRAHFLKFLEDEFIWAKIDQKFIRETLTHLEWVDQKFNIKPSMLQKWYVNILLPYLTRPPSQTFSSLVQKDADVFFNISKEEIMRWNRLLPSLKEDPTLRYYMAQLLEYMKKSFKKN